MNKKYLIGIGIIFIGVLFIIIRVIIPNDNNSNILSDEEDKKIQNKEISCIKEKLDKYITNGKEIVLSDVTDKKDKIEYFKGYSDDNNSYIMFMEHNGTYDYEVMKDFDLYFINKYDIYQKFSTNFGIYILIHTENNDLEEELINSCYINPYEVDKVKKIPKKVVNKLKNTTKIKFEYSDKEITDKNVIDKLINAVENSNQTYYKGVDHAYLCDGPAKLFMYDNNGKLIDTLHVYGDGKRLIPESISKGCEYYNTKEDINKILEEGTNSINHGYVDYSEVCASALELIYEDEDYKYYFSCIKSDYV